MLIAGSHQSINLAKRLQIPHREQELLVKTLELTKWINSLSEKKECSNEQVVFPFYKCCQIKCSSRVDNEIKLTDIEFDNIKHIGMILETGPEKSKITIKDVISFCNLPKSIENIVINSYPWENVKSITLNLEVSHIIE